MDCNVANRTIFCRDNLDVLQRINTRCIDLIYLDPPFNKKKVFTAPIGSAAEGAEFSDIFREEDIKDEWVSELMHQNPELHYLLIGVKTMGNSYNYCYLVYMAIRLIECHRVLKETGSIYLHCDPTMSHYLKLVLDCIFGENNFKNEIVWYYYNKYSAGKKIFGRNFDQILFYSKTDNYFFSAQREKRDKPVRQLVRENVDGILKNKKGDDGKVIYRTVNDKKIDAVWRMPCLQPSSTEWTSYPTQKPLNLLYRIIKASSNEGDIVLDPFCGCATTCVAAEWLNRKWIGIDISQKAYELVKQRLTNEAKSGKLQADLINYKPLNWDKEIKFVVSPPNRTDDGADLRDEKFVYIISNKAFPDMLKVGIATDVKRRLSSYQTSDPDRGYKVEYEFKTPEYKTLEPYIHSKFKGDHEWVRGSIKEIKNAIENYTPEQSELSQL